jgi:NAD(P)-dependent dehydrogenase (short-subunit alcohol dehydrogenase family)
MELAGKIVVLTGAGSGLGESLAKQLSEKGCDLILVDKTFRNSGNGSTPWKAQVDLTSPEEIDAFCAAVLERSWT